MVTDLIKIYNRIDCATLIINNEYVELKPFRVNWDVVKFASSLMVLLLSLFIFLCFVSAHIFRLEPNIL